MDTTFHQCRQQGKNALNHQQPRHTEEIQQNRGKGHQQNLHDGVEHGGYGVALLLHPLGNELRVNAVVRQLIDGAKRGQKQGICQIADIGKSEKHQVNAHEGVQNGVDHIAADQKGLPWQTIHPRREDQRQKEGRNQLDGNDERGCQRASRFIKDQK